MDMQKAGIAAGFQGLERFSAKADQEGWKGMEEIRI